MKKHTEKKRKNLFITIIACFIFFVISYFYIKYVKEINCTNLNHLLFLLSPFIGLIFLNLIYVFHQKKKIYESTYVDSLTKLGNERYFKEYGTKFLEDKKNNRYVLILDINKFKSFNRTYGYHFSDLTLKEFGNHLKQSMPEGSIVCRLLRDIFVVAFQYDGNINQFLDQTFDDTVKLKVDHVDINLNVSVGVYKLLKSDKDINKVLDKAYMAHAKIKGMYRYNYYIFDKLLEQQFVEEEAIETSMQKALKQKEFQVFYQPKIFTDNEMTAGCEALVRWCKDDQIIMPNKFIPLFEKNQFIIKLDLYVFEQVCKDLKEWKEKYNFSLPVSVNVSKEHFIDEHFIDEYVKIAKKYHIDPGCIDLEITETCASNDNIIKILKDIKQKGFIISLDDFGTGYSSLSMIESMPIDIIKIDRVFVESIHYDSKKNMMNYIIAISNHLGLKTIVEGVENKKELDFVKKLNCDIVQGYYYSKPLLKEQFEKNYIQKNM